VELTLLIREVQPFILGVGEWEEWKGIESLTQFNNISRLVRAFWEVKER